MDTYTEEYTHCYVYSPSMDVHSIGEENTHGYVYSPSMDVHSIGKIHGHLEENTHGYVDGCTQYIQGYSICNTFPHHHPWMYMYTYVLTKLDVTYIVKPWIVHGVTGHGCCKTIHNEIQTDYFDTDEALLE